MKSEIVAYVKKVCATYRLNALYRSGQDYWMIHRNGRAIQSFTTEQFYQIPRRARFDHFRALLKVGLTNNIGESYRHQLYLPMKWGKKIA